ncbi:MAG: Ammonium transporter [Bryobacterales bacterium]|nr:Ammonium transporter [Bryobacterales bacterium]
MNPPAALPDLAAAICALCILLVPLATAGLALINTGLGRSRNAAHAMMSSLCVLAVAAVAYFVCGFSWQGFPGRAAYAAQAGGKLWNWIGRDPFFLRGVDFGGSSASFAAWFGMFSAGLAALIPLGSGAERWRLGSICASAAILAGWTYPLFAHWVWGGGWLAQLGANFGLGRGFVDVGGAGSIHAVGGLTALAIAWILRPRRGKFAQGMPTAIPGHNAVFVLFGCLLALLGWLGLNTAGAILFAGMEAGRVPLVAINTMLSAASATLASTLITRARFGKPDASLSANGWVGGLVASSAVCAFVIPVAAILIGLVAGALVTLSIEWLEVHLHIDDPGGAISVHGMAGIWGLLAIGFFDHLPGSSGSNQWLAQMVGVATLLGFVFPLTYALNWLLNRISPQRVSLDGERQGMDLHELGANAYPELVTHQEDFTPR